MSEQATPEVARLLAVIPFLPPRSIGFLVQQRISIQEMIVRQISSILNFWEVNHVDLDPIQREFVLDAIVLSLGSVAIGFERAVVQSGDFRSDVAERSDGTELHEDQGSG